MFGCLLLINSITAGLFDGNFGEVFVICAVCITNKGTMSVSTVSVRPLCPELEQKAKLELNETPKKLEEGINHLKEWIAKQPHLRARTDDQWLAAFLRGCKHSLERAKKKIDLYYSLRAIAPEMTALKYTDPKFLELAKLGIGVILPKRANPTDPRVVLVRASQYDPNKFVPSEFFPVTWFVQQIVYMEDDPFVISGTTCIFDLQGLNRGHFLQLTPAEMKKIVVAGQDASPIRLKSAHFLGMPPYFQTMFNIGKKLLNEKNRNKIYVHSGDFNELHKYVSKEILPEEYGGNGGTIQEIIDYWLNKLDEYRGWYEEDAQYGTNESKRPGKPKTAESLFGVEGSFRQLEID